MQQDVARIINGGVDGIESQIAWLRRDLAAVGHRVPRAVIDRLAAVRCGIDAIIMDQDGNDDDGEEV